MTDIITDSAGLSAPTQEPKVAKKRTTNAKTATKKAAATAPVKVESVSIQEAETLSEEGQKVITVPTKKKTSRSSNTHSKDTGTISSHAADSSLAKKQDTEKKPAKKVNEETALWSNKNIRWTGVGYLSRGYNIVKKEAAEKWLTREGVREATAEEVATYYGK